MFRKYFETKAATNSIEIDDTYNKILFSSDNPREVLAVQQYFSSIWATEIVDQNEAANLAYLSRIKSIRIADYGDIISRLNLRFREKLFYDFSSGYIFEDSAYYILSKAPYNWLTIFDKARKEILFLRSDDRIHNIHLSQMIKEPLALWKKLKGKLLLHAAAGVIGEQSVLFPAQKGAGKSTLIMGLLNRGENYLGNDSIFLSCLQNNLYLEKNPHCLHYLYFS